MVKGAEEKQIIIDKIKEIFPEAFEYDKAIRIPIGDVQIKVALTCAKDNVECGGDVALPGAKKIETVTPPEGLPWEEEKPAVVVSEEEKSLVNSLAATLGIL